MLILPIQCRTMFTPSLTNLNDFDHINSIQVVLKVEKIHQIAEATLHVNQGEIHASSDDENMYAAIDSLVDKLVRQLNKHKEKLHSH